ncbi:MAG: FkbM family methyltransferase [Solirubrobacteraceae bacterium]
MISYAQNGEDVVLARAFSSGYTGFYIDVGASDPVVDSVTKHFYDEGWSGLNIEPAALIAGELREARPRDVTLELAIGRESATRRFYELPREMTGCSTFSEALADSYRREGQEINAHDVTVQTLAQVCAEHAAPLIDFLKVDVEGAEAEVLAGADFARFRPRIVVVEATRPGTAVVSHEEWEPQLLSAGYACTLFDGLNRFYVRDEDRALAPALSVPAGVLDNHVPYRYWRWRADLEATHADLVAARTGHEAAERRVVGLEAGLNLTRAELARSQAALRDARTELEETRLALQRTLADQRRGGG